MSDQAEEQSLEERMLNVLEAEEPETEEEVQEEAEEPTEELEEETEDEESDEEQPTATVKLKVNGEEIDKPLEEVIALAQQGIDYTQKTQKVAEERKQFEEYVQTFKVQEQNFQQYVQAQQASIQDLARLTAIDDQIAQYQQLNWDDLSDRDPAETQKMFIKYNHLQSQRVQMANILAQKQNQAEQEQQARISKAAEENAKILQRDIPAWSGELYNKLMEYVVKDYGYTTYEASNAVDARAWKLAHKAYLYDQLQANPASKQKISEAKPIIKPGAKDSKQQATSQTKAMRDQLRKTGDGELAQKLIERML